MRLAVGARGLGLGARCIGRGVVGAGSSVGPPRLVELGGRDKVLHDRAVDSELVERGAAGGCCRLVDQGLENRVLGGRRGCQLVQFPRHTGGVARWDSTYDDSGVPALRLLVLVELGRADGALASLLCLGVCLVYETLSSGLRCAVSPPPGAPYVRS